MNVSFISSDSNGLIKTGFNTIEIGPESDFKVCLVCGIHGNEITPQYIAEKLINQQEKLNSRVCIILDSNQQGILMQQRENPIDKVDLNRIFPGNNKGSISERISASLFNFVQKFDLVIELHTFENMNMETFGIMPNEPVNKLSFSTLLHFAPSCIWIPEIKSDEEKKYSGTLSISLVNKSKPSFAIEFPSCKTLREIDFENFTNRLINAINNREKPIKCSIPLVKRQEIKSQYTGIFIPIVEKNKNIHKGDIIGEIFSFQDCIKNKVISSEEGLLFQIRHRGFINQGEALYAIGTIYNEEQIFK